MIDRLDPEAPKLREELKQITTGQFEAGLCTEPAFRDAMARWGFTAREIDDHVRLHRPFRTLADAVWAGAKPPFKSGLPE